jgi:acetyl xylan esterase AXE1
MEAFGPYMDGYCNVHNQLWEHIRAKTMRFLEDADEKRENLKTPEEVHEQAAFIKHSFIDSLGGLPANDAPLNPQIVRTIERDAYTIECILFESEPQVYVTSNLYLPRTVVVPMPAVLFLSGHHLEARLNPEYQRVCHDLAINGFVVFAIDPTGQGERITHLDPDTGKETIGWGTTEHMYHGQQCALTGSNVARHFLVDAMRALDYLETRPEVDARRIGVTGNSGGGTQTSLLCMAGDPRVAAAMPCTYVTSREHLFMAGLAQDAEQIQFGMTRNGINFDHFFYPIVPKPLLLGAVDSDYFSPEGTALTYERLKGVYDLLGHSDDVDWILAPGLHMYCKELREAAVNWFSRHLMGKKSAFVPQADDDIPTLAEEELWCTSKGHVHSDFPDARSPHDRNLDLIPTRTTADDGQLRDRVTEALGINHHMKALRWHQPLYPRVLRDLREDGLRARSIFFLSEPDIMVAGCYVHLADAEPALAHVILTNAGTMEMDATIKKHGDRMNTGEGIFVVDVRGRGAVAPHAINQRNGDFPGAYFNTENWLSGCAYMNGDCLLGMRVYDVIRAAQCLREVTGIDLVGVDAAGLEPCLWGYLAAAVDNSLKQVHVDGLIESFEAIVRTRLYRTDFLPSALIHGVLKHFDLPELAPLFKGRSLTIHHAPVELGAESVEAAREPA